MIHLEQVSKVFRPANGSPVHALAGVDLDVEPGQFVVVRGPSGAGKSTLLSLIGGLVRPTSGRVVVAGEDLGAMSPAARARFRAQRIGFVFQTFHLLPYLTVVENVCLAASPGQEATCRARAKELLEHAALGHRLAHRPAELSTGESQRVAIVRAMLSGPQLLLADEPTGNLDPENSAMVLGLLAGFHRGGGTVLLVTHQELADQYAQRVVFLRDGRVTG
jgi:putative ABC transport system ATP-binding protein